MYETMTPVLASMGRIEWSRRRSASVLVALVVAVTLLQGAALGAAPTGSTVSLSRDTARFLKAPITKTLPIESPRAAGLIRLPGGRQLPILPSA